MGTNSMKLCAREVRRLLPVVLIVLCALHAAGAAIRNDLRSRCIRSVPRSFTQHQQEQLCDSSLPSTSLNRQDPTVPGQCAKLALGGRPLQSAKVTSRVELLRAASIIQLCSGTQSTGPGKCWVAIPAQIRQQMHAAAVSTYVGVNVDSEVATTPLVRVCQHARDDLPAQCLLLWLEMSKTLSKQDAHDALDTAVTLCKNFGGEVSALKNCVKQTTPHLRAGAGSEIGILQICQLIGDGKNLRAVVDCATKLGRKNVLPSTIAQVCAGVTDVVQAHICFLEAQHQLRWMDQDAQISLCTDTTAHTAFVPIDCALAMKKTAQTFRPANPSHPLTPEFGLFVANLCRNATNATTVIECVRLVPVHAFTTDQVLRLCAASIHTQIPENGEAISLYPMSCAAQARLILQRIASSSKDGWNSLGMSASAAAVHVCEQVRSVAPSKCLSDTQHDRVLPVKLKVQLCRRAISNSPQRCIHSLRKFINAQRMDIYDAVMACRETESLGPAECVIELFQVTASVTGKVAGQLCHAAKDVEPARCFVASPPFYDNETKVLLCNHAESSAPASCVRLIDSRFTIQPSMKVALCRGATTVAPAVCAIEAPFGMDEASVVELCRSAVSTAPARCAHEVSTSLRVPWRRVAQVCAGATSTTPGRCLVHHIRYSRLRLHTLDDDQVVIKCRLAVAQPASLGIAQASYNCLELRPMCPLQLMLNVLDQYGDPIVESSHHAQGSIIVHVTATFTGSYDHHIHRSQPALQGPLYTTITNGSAIFSNLLFTGAGEFTLTFRAGGGITEEVVRVVVHPDHAAEALQFRCNKLFTRFQCCAEDSPSPKRDYQHNELQILLLPHQLQLSAVSCGQYWLDTIGGVVFSGIFPPNHMVYILPRPLYEFLTNVNVPCADMSSWELLGLTKGETNRTTIRRHYHRRSLEWHPDKWHTLAALLSPARRQELLGIYTLITHAYDQLMTST